MRAIFFGYGLAAAVGVAWVAAGAAAWHAALAAWLGGAVLTMALVTTPWTRPWFVTRRDAAPEEAQSLRRFEDDRTLDDAPDRVRPPAAQRGAANG